MSSSDLIRANQDLQRFENEELTQPAISYRTPPVVPQEFTLWDYWRVLLKRKWTVVGTLIVVVTLVGVATLRMTPIYDAVGRISISSENTNLLSFKDPGSQPEDWDYASNLETQVRILSSDGLALQVAKKLGLDKKAEFGGGQQDNLTGPPQLDNAREAALISAVKGGLRVRTIPDTRMIEIRYSSPDPRFAADVVNTTSTAYIENNFKTKFESTMQAADWLSKQLADLQVRVETSQEKLVRYQKEHDILGLDEKQNITTSKLDELNRELTQAEADRIQKQAVYELTSRGNPESMSAVAQNPLVQKLREEESDLKTQIAQQMTQFGPSYPKVAELNNRLKQVQSNLDSEVRKSADRIHREYQTALQRENMLRAALESQKHEANKLNESAIEYNLLKRDAESNRQLYEGLLQKLKEAGIAAGLNSSNIRIVDVARVPLAPARPNLPRNLELAFLLGLTGGVALAFALEALDNTVRTPEQAESISGLPSLGMVPMSSRLNMKARYGRKQLPANASSASERVELVALSRPTSEIAESYRALRTSILLSQMGSPPKVILVTSALPQEGKTTTCINSAVVLAQQGRRVLLVDGDLRRPSIHKNLGIRPRAGLTDLLTGSETAQPLIIPSPQLPNLFVLPAGRTPPHPAELLGSPLMKNLLQQWREQFDHIIIDSPPALSVTDAVLLSVQADTVVLVIRSGQTTKTALRRARDLLMQVNAKMMGVVVNAVDLNSPDYYYYYYSGSKYGSYYTDQSSSKTQT
jgi:capsular exopolysaccharide synthesis family protein